ncbi:glycosyl hydrolase 115 family protein [Niabella sp. CC-SYL272]|uniref:glycosyl hydrolase 115 family protein n=1 Tax=Niabella agricola TaxID=2891571 RepID=UPI001F3A6D6D|nr:glycosyl hydrolase 115 family protein [Niabella agricola]MCF3107719.1 glycosyl hydrolase 115 family protein [Niabella agricola]
MVRKYALIAWAVLLSAAAYAQELIVEKKTATVFPVATNDGAAFIYIDAGEDSLVHKAARLLQDDIERVTGKRPVVTSGLGGSLKNVIMIGTVERSATIRTLASRGKINTRSLEGKWEAFQLQTVRNPVAGVQNALVITGSDRRGAAYGVAELSAKMGVSPWYWWADVPVKRKPELFFKNGIYHYPSPSVKYRGIFLNDEAPALSGWTKEKFGGFNHKMYERVFELLIRLKANYLWPAMWGNAFNDDDTLNPVLAHQWGIVMGSSHHEPMLRAQTEWKRYGKGAWNYETNEAGLKTFWKKGIENMRDHESIVTVGMRGDGDEPMTQGTAIQLLERIVADQRKIITQVTGKPASETPQLWALYKEVQDYYDAGMRVPGDVTLLLCDDNWGNIRRLPKLGDPPRKGGYGVYYHFDYVGDPRNYKWINTNNLARVWEQMHRAYAYNARQIWIVNVGDLKPMELPISFFLDYAWNVHRWNEDNLFSYYTKWAGEQFGGAHAKEIAEVLERYAEYASRKKPELLDAATYSIENYNEAARITNDWDQLLKKAEALKHKLPQEQGAAFYQLVLHPVQAYSNLQHLYTAVARNRYDAKQGNVQANKYADDAKRFYRNDSLITLEYHQLNNGKWNHMMSQTHIGYTYWQEPRVQKIPELVYVPDRARAAAITTGAAVTAAAPVPAGGNIFYEKDGYVSISATRFTRKTDAAGVQWKIIPGISREGDGITTFPVTKEIDRLSKETPHLQYDIYTTSAGNATLQVYCSPTLNYQDAERGLQYAVSIDDAVPQIVSINKFKVGSREWAQTVSDNINITATDHKILGKGKHTVRYWMLSPGIVLQKLVLDLGGLKPSYLGPQPTIGSNKKQIFR